MKILHFPTGTPDNEKLILSVQALGHELHVFQYDVPGFDIVGTMAALRPDVGIYIGAIREFHNEWVPSAETLAQANAIAPMIFICPDSADPPWWPVIEEYHAKNSFKVMVAIDGNKETPIQQYGRVSLTPLDPGCFPNVEWNSRRFLCGFSGGVGHRHEILNHLSVNGVLTHFAGGPHPIMPYRDMCNFYTQCKYVINAAYTGTGSRRHVKGRFLEAGMAGAVVLEPRDSPAKELFVPGYHYLEWETPDQALWHIKNSIPEHQYIAARLRAELVAKHSGPIFWRQAFREAGVMQ